MATKSLNLNVEARSDLPGYPIKPRDIEGRQLFNEVFAIQNNGFGIPITAICIVRFLQDRNDWHPLFKMEAVNDRFSHLISLNFDWFLERGYLVRQDDWYLVTTEFIVACQAPPIADAI